VSIPIASCRSCGAPIVWAVTSSGKRMPLDARAAVVFGLDTTSDPPLATRGQGDPLYVSHFATCPNAAQHRKSR
jgi:hypothetical protein